MQYLSIPVLVTVASSLLITTTLSHVYFEERFEDGSKWEKRWKVPSKYSKGSLGKFVLSHGKWFADEKINYGLQTSEDARFYALSTKFTPFTNKDKPLVIQFTIKHEQSIDCGGGYIKILPSDTDQSTFNGESPYLIMFGPDHCGNKHHVHVIVNYDGKNHLIKKHIPAPSDDLTHIYTLAIRPDQTYSVFVDGEESAKGSLTEDWSFLPPKTIPDPSAKKPADWVEEREIDDPEDKQPEDWDENQPRQIPDDSATQPADWDEEMDGKWVRPMIDNPKWKPTWTPKKIKNPAYKGPWAAPQIDNPDYRTDSNIYKFDNIGGVGIDIWQVKSGSIFDNILLTDSLEYAEKVAKKVYKDLKEKEVKARDAWVAANTPKTEGAVEKQATDVKKESVNPAKNEGEKDVEDDLDDEL
jgi:calreticulin